MNVDPPAGTNALKNSMAFGSTHQASPAPQRKSGDAAPTKAKEYLRSRRVRPGGMKAQNWYSHTGEARTTPVRMDSWTLRLNGPAGSAKLIEVWAAPRWAWISRLGRTSPANTWL